MDTEREKMLAGELYDPSDTELVAARRMARVLCRQLNDSADSERELRKAVVYELFGKVGHSTWIEPPFYCDYGKNTLLGDDVYFNFNCVILDAAMVSIGDNTMFGPAVQIYTSVHPLGAAQRRTKLESAKPVGIGADVWVGGGAIICPGVRIGSRSVIGAGSVVTRDIPDDVLAVGNPCIFVKKLDG